MEKEKNFGDVINLSEDFSINLKENGTVGKQFTEKKMWEKNKSLQFKKKSPKQSLVFTS